MLLVSIGEADLVGWGGRSLIAGRLFARKTRVGCRWGMWATSVWELTMGAKEAVMLGFLGSAAGVEQL